MLINQWEHCQVKERMQAKEPFYRTLFPGGPGQPIAADLNEFEGPWLSSDIGILLEIDRHTTSGSWRQNLGYNNCHCHLWIQICIFSLLSTSRGGERQWTTISITGVQLVRWDIWFQSLGFNHHIRPDPPALPPSFKTNLLSFERIWDTDQRAREKYEQ